MAESVVLPMYCLYGIYLEGQINLGKGKEQDLNKFKNTLKKFTIELDELNKISPESRLGGAISFGPDGWSKITKLPKPKELKSADELKYMPNTTQRDMLIHILSDRFDTCSKLAEDTIENFGEQFECKSEVHGYRRYEMRDYTNFIDGTENPDGEEMRTKYGLVPKGQPHENGSYVFTQRYIHHLDNWAKMPIQKQQQVFGRTKKESEEIPYEKRPINSHVSRTDLSEDGKDLKIVRQSLPYGQITGEKGLFFISYACSLHNIEKQLESMFGQLDGKKDLILDYTTPASGSFYFAPSKKEILNL